MNTRLILPGCLLIMLAMLMGCGSGLRELNVPGAAPAVGAAGMGAQLPELAQLPAPARELSMHGSGYYNIPLKEHVATAGTINDATSIALTGAAIPAYAVYGIYGFDGDNGPTGARITTSSVSGEYYVAFSDFVAGSWLTTGPFTGSAEVTIPATDEYTSPTAFTSPKGVCYVVLLAGPGNAATVTKFELGVQGGQLGPEPVFQLNGGGGANGYLLTWTHSPSVQDPDFGGYVVERAPLVDGDFAVLSPAGLQDSYFVDNSAVLDQAYRYRVCTADVSNNRSLWREWFGGPETGGLADPVAVLRLPHGPLTSPASIQLDLSESFDPEGEAISTYTFQVNVFGAPISGPSPTADVTLQPGCYMLTAEVEVPGPPVRTGTTRVFLKVYPSWEAAPVIVRDTTPWAFIPVERLYGSRMSANATANRLTITGIDVIHGGISVWTGPADNPSNLQLQRLPLLENSYSSAEPVEIGDKTYFAYRMDETIVMASIDGAKLEQQPLDDSTASSVLASATDGSSAWWLFNTFDGFNTDLTVRNASLQDNQEVVDSTGAIGAMDAVYSPAGAIDVVYSDAATTQWVRWEIATAMVVDSAALAATPATMIDVELDPGTGRPVVAYFHTDRVRYRELDGGGIWTPEVLIDNANDNKQPFDLIVDDGTKYAFFATDPAHQANLYEETGGAWNPVYTPSYSADSGYGVHLLPRNGESDRALLLDTSQGSPRYLSALHDDGSETVLWDLPSSDAQCSELRAAAGSDGLHAVWQAGGNAVTRHALSVDGGLNWTDPGNVGPFMRSTDLVGRADGSVYYSCYNGGNNELYWWDGATFQLRQSFAAVQDHRSFFTTMPVSTLTWFCYETGISTMHYVDAAEPAYVDSPAAFASGVVWNGAATGLSLMNETWMGQIGGATIDQSHIGWSQNGAGEAAPLVEPLVDGSFEFYMNFNTWGKTMDGIAYLMNSAELVGERFYATPGRLLDVYVYDQFPYSAPQSSELTVGPPIGLDSTLEIFNTEQKRTLSCAMAQGVTGVTVISSIDGKHTYFAWSNFGEWEDLELPAGIDHMQGPELLVGLDGRWHILYHNWQTDQVMCLNGM